MHEEGGVKLLHAKGSFLNLGHMPLHEHILKMKRSHSICAEKRGVHSYAAQRETVEGRIMSDRCKSLPKHQQMPLISLPGNIIHANIHASVCCVSVCTSLWIPQGVNDVLKRGPDTVTVTDDLTEGQDCVGRG